MDILLFEKRYSDIKNLLQEPHSERRKLLVISDFFTEILLQGNESLIEVYISDLISNYISLIKIIKVRGLKLEKLNSLIEQLQVIIILDFLASLKSELQSALNHLLFKRDQLASWLNNTYTSKSRSLIYFPLIEICNDYNLSGFLETISIEISKGEKKFLINSISYDSNTQIIDQLEIAWDLAIKYCSKLIKKINDQHLVNIRFENNFGIYSGNSFGMALLVAFIEALLKFYKSPTVVKINGVIAITGAIDKNSRLIAASKTIIETKTETVFYSDASLFCVPKTDEIRAEEKLKELKVDFPNRNLIIVGLNDLDDLLSRRNVVDIHKINMIERTTDYVLRKWKSIFLAALLTVLLSFVFIMDFDDNPAMFSQNGKLLLVKNKNGKVLWEIKLSFEPNTRDDRINSSVKIVDVNGDGMNEVLICDEDIPFTNSDKGRVVCFDNNKNIMWKYTLRDSISTFRKWTTSYIISLIDTVSIDGRKILFLMSRNTPNFPSAVFKLDLVTGKRIDSLKTLWNAGTITNGLIGDFNEDGQTEIILAGVHNGFQRAILFSVDLNNIGGQTPAPDRYNFNSIPRAMLNEFILLPHSDYGLYYSKYNSVPPQHLQFINQSKNFEFSTMEGLNEIILFYYGFDNKLNFQWVDCADNAQKLRDSLVIKGILQEPFTNTNEYFEILRKQIQYWNGERFINIDERKK